jgi:N-acetylmuramoyl-L-alanine amidase
VIPPPEAAVKIAPETPSPVEQSEPKQVAAAKPAPPPEPEAEEEVYEDVPLGTPAKQNSGGTHSLTRVLGLKLGRVVIDPGHGGRDTGTIGPSGLREKEVTLDVARRLAKLIEERMGSEVVLTRNADVSVPLEARAKLANEKQADLFLSIHVNASRYSKVNGVETFYLNFTRSRADLEVAARENAGSNQSIHELSDLVQKIALDDKVQESRDLATSVQTAVHALAAKHYSEARNRGVKKAPFVVLIGAQMPSILVELGFISNSREEKLMKTKEFRQELAESLYVGLSTYASSLSHFQVAQTKALDEE